MKAVDFIRKFGWCEALSVLLKSEYHHEVDVYLVPLKEFTFIAIKPDESDPYVSLSELKQYTDAYELVESWGGLNDAKLYDLSHCKNKPESAGYKLMKAIQLVESVESKDDRTDHCTNIKNHVSPLTKVIDK